MHVQLEQGIPFLPWENLPLQDSALRERQENFGFESCREAYPVVFAVDLACKQALNIEQSLL